MSVGSATAGADAPQVSRPATAQAQAQARCPRLGIYSGWDQRNDLKARRWFGALPQISTTYLDTHQRLNISGESKRINRGTALAVTITTAGTQRIAAIAGGPGHPGWDRAERWLNRYIGDLSILADINGSVPVYATLDHEFRVNVRLGKIRGESANPKVYGKALSRFYKMAEAANPRIRTTYWFVGYERRFEAKVGNQFRNLPDTYVVDPYSNQAGKSLREAAAPDVRWIRRQSWYTDQEIGLGEFGMAVSAGDRAMGRYYTRVRHTMKDLGISWGIMFNSERMFDTRIVRRSDGRRFPAAVDAFGTSLRRAGRC